MGWRGYASAMDGFKSETGGSFQAGAALNCMNGLKCCVGRIRWESNRGPMGVC